MWVTGGSIASGHTTEDEAKANARLRNKNAEAMDLETRYEVRSK